MEFQKAYKLVDVQDHTGRSKVDSRPLYQDRIGCIAKNLRVKPYYGQEVVWMDFVQDPKGNWICRPLHTSPILEITQSDGCLKIGTKNSVYLLEPAELLEPEYPDEAELIELFLCEEATRFCKGVYHDGEKKPHELDCLVNVGMTADSCLIYQTDEGLSGNFLCRYFPEADGIQFYDTLYGQQDYSTRMLIHNSGKRPIKVRFSGYDAVWTVEAGGEKYITPYCGDGADGQSSGECS